MSPHPPSPSEEALRLHQRACERGEKGYMDPVSGLFSPTSLFLRQRGHCCGLGCRHCPWDELEQRRAGRPARPSYPWPPSGSSES